MYQEVTCLGRPMSNTEANGEELNADKLPGKAEAKKIDT